MMAVVHDLAEAQGTTQTGYAYFSFLTLPPYVASSHEPLVGDIAPREGIPNAEKRRLETVCLFLSSPPLH